MHNSGAALSCASLMSQEMLGKQNKLDACTAAKRLDN
jgi:hypothetical protein